MSLRGSKRASNRTEEASVCKRRKTEAEDAQWQARPINDLKIPTTIYNRSAPEAPAELFRFVFHLRIHVYSIGYKRIFCNINKCSFFMRLFIIICSNLFVCMRLCINAATFILWNLLVFANAFCLLHIFCVTLLFYIHLNVMLRDAFFYCSN